MASEHPKSLSHNHPAFQTQGSTKIPIYVGNRSQRTPSVERRLKLSRKSNSRENSQVPSPTSLDPSRKSEQRSPEDDSSLFSISGMTSDNEYESNMSESSGEASKPTQRGTKWYKPVECKLQFCSIFGLLFCKNMSFDCHYKCQLSLSSKKKKTARLHPSLHSPYHIMYYVLKSCTKSFYINTSWTALLDVNF